MILLADEGATERLGQALARELRAGDTVALFGTLGAGKTTLARGVLRGLGFAGDVASPTFPIVQVYETQPPLWHVDLYRIEHPEELEELGLDEARLDAALLVEWPERLPRLWPDTLRLSLAIRPDGARALTADVPPAWGGAMAAPMIPPPHAPDFLAALGWEGCEIRPLTGDASFRRYFRVHHGKRRAVLMDAPPPHEDPRPFIAVAEWLSAAGLSAPTILGRDLAHGLLLLDDFGDARLRETLDAAPTRETELYGIAVDLLVKLHRHSVMPGLKPHGLDEWLNELHLFTNWYCPAMEIEPDMAGWEAAWAEVLTPVAGDGLGPVTALRDFHAENVMLVAGRRGIARFGLLDFQDAVAGHPAYDLVSMLEDARRDVTPSVERAMLDRYMKAMGQGADFERAYWVLAAQRNTRILGVFTRLWKRDDKPGYRKFQPRMWGLLERDLLHPELAPVRAWFDANIPETARVAPWLEEIAA